MQKEEEHPMNVSNETVKAARAGDQDASRTLVKAMEPQVIKLVTSICGQYHREDGKAEAQLALWDAVLTFDPANVTTFNTYAHGKVRLALLAFISTNTPGPTVPERSVKRYTSNLAAANGDPELALKMLEESTLARTQTGSPAAFTAAHTALTDPKHIDRLTSEGEEGELEAVELAATDVDVEETALNRVIVGDLLAGLTSKQAAILERTYGLNGHNEHTDNETATALGISRPRVVTIRKAALRSLASTNPSLKGMV